MNSEEMIHCQSCGMPLTGKEMLGTEKDGSASEDFCKYCYEKGEFLEEMTMEDMINFCVPTVAEHLSIDEKEAKQQMEEFFPSLKRWKQQ